MKLFKREAKGSTHAHGAITLCTLFQDISILIKKSCTSIILLFYTRTWRTNCKQGEAAGSPSSFYWSQSPTPGTSGGSIRREVVCGLPVNPKQRKTKWRQWLICVIFPQGTYSGVNAICTKCPAVISAGALSAGTEYGKVLGVNAANIFLEYKHILKCNMMLS